MIRNLKVAAVEYPFGSPSGHPAGESNIIIDEIGKTLSWESPVPPSPDDTYSYLVQFFEYAIRNHLETVLEPASSETSRVIDFDSDLTCYEIWITRSRNDIVETVTIIIEDSACTNEERKHFVIRR